MFMNRSRNCYRLIIAVIIMFLFGLSPALAQLSRSPQAPPLQYSPQLVAEIKRVQQAAFESDYAYRQVAHLANNIGPRLSGSAQAQAAVEYVAGELKARCLEGQLEKVMVPHWGRGDETASLGPFPGQAEKTDQKSGLFALGGRGPA